MADHSRDRRRDYRADTVGRTAWRGSDSGVGARQHLRPEWPPSDNPTARRSWERPAPQRTGRPPASTRRRRLDANRWHWLLLVPIVLPLLTPIYNRTEPTLGGVPFFYWGQLMFAILASAVVTIVHLATRER